MSPTSIPNNETLLEVVPADVRLNEIRDDIVVIGCGNLLRGDDGVGPIMIRELFEEGFGDKIALVDGGTAGMDVGFKMRGASIVVIVDACISGNLPGTVYKVPGDVLENLPPPGQFQSHSFRWDHSLAFSRWLLGDEYPTEVLVYLIEAQSLELGAMLSQKVDEAKAVVKTRIKEIIYDRL